MIIKTFLVQIHYDYVTIPSKAFVKKKKKGTRRKSERRRTWDSLVPISFWFLIFFYLNKVSEGNATSLEKSHIIYMLI